MWSFLFYIFFVFIYSSILFFLYLEFVLCFFSCTSSSDCHYFSFYWTISFFLWNTIHYRHFGFPTYHSAELVDFFYYLPHFFIYYFSFRYSCTPFFSSLSFLRVPPRYDLYSIFRLLCQLYQNYDPARYLYIRGLSQKYPTCLHICSPELSDVFCGAWV